MHFKTSRKHVQKDEYVYGWTLYDHKTKIAISTVEYKTNMECLQAIWYLQKHIPEAEIQDCGDW